MPAHDVAILGAGAAGLMAAIAAAERGRRVILLERNRKPGVKIFMSGGTRCNVTHDGPPDTIATAFGKRGGRFLRPSLLAFPPSAVMDFFERAGVALKTEAPHGKVFPRSDRAADVQRALVEAARARGVTLRAEARVTGVRRESAGFAVAIEGAGELLVPRVILATGGQSYPRCGTDGCAYGFARGLGLATTTPRPALVPLVLAAPLACPGTALVDARVGLAVRGGGKLVAVRRGELLFTHRGLSGPAALDLSGELTARTSGALADVPPGTTFDVALDLVPEVSHEWLQEDLSQRERGRGARTVAAALHGLGLPRALVAGLLELALIPAERTVQELRREERATVVRVLKDARLPASGTLGFEKAEVTAGGVALDELLPATLEARRVPGLHVVGEALDVDGPIGGYNFQAAWSTGWAAGLAV